MGNIFQIIGQVRLGLPSGLARWCSYFSNWIPFLSPNNSITPCKNRPAPSPGQMSYKATNPGSVLSLSLEFLSVSVVL